MLKALLSTGHSPVGLYKCCKTLFLDYTGHRLNVWRKEKSDKKNKEMRAGVGERKGLREIFFSDLLWNQNLTKALETAGVEKGVEKV